LVGFGLVGVVRCGPTIYFALLGKHEMVKHKRGRHH
jgi:hypothetical protein